VGVKGARRLDARGRSLFARERAITTNSIDSRSTVDLFSALRWIA
jgi:hypothetical protein